jgi:hypothetical protein
MITPDTPPNEVGKVHAYAEALVTELAVYLKTLPPQPLLTKADEIVDTRDVGVEVETTKFSTIVESQPAVVVSLLVYCPEVLIKVPPKL